MAITDKQKRYMQFLLIEGVNKAIEGGVAKDSHFVANARRALDILSKV